MPTLFAVGPLMQEEYDHAWYTSQEGHPGWIFFSNHRIATDNQVDYFTMVNSLVDIRGSFNNVLHVLAGQGHVEATQMMLSVLAGDGNDRNSHKSRWTDSSEYSPLPAINAQNHRGNSPFHYAAQAGSVSCAEALIAAGADNGLINQDGFDPAGEAEHWGNFQFAAYARTLTPRKESTAVWEYYNQWGGRGIDIDSEQKTSMRKLQRKYWHMGVYFYQQPRAFPLLAYKIDEDEERFVQKVREMRREREKIGPPLLPNEVMLAPWDWDWDRIKNKKLPWEERKEKMEKMEKEKQEKEKKEKKGKEKEKQEKEKKGKQEKKKKKMGK